MVPLMTTDKLIVRARDLSQSLGSGRYGGVQITFRKSQDTSLSFFDPLRYIDGISVGLGIGASLPVVLTVPLQ
jgi:hypothetical protein